MKKISLQFDYSLEYEIRRIKYTLDKSEWFIENNYSKWIKLPAGEKLENVDKNKSVDYLFDNAKEEYNQKDYEKTKDVVNKQWIKFSSRLEKYFQETSLKPEEIYLIHLTKYGVGGSYKLPNEVIVNFQGKHGIGISNTVIHEIVHLSIQPFINKYNIEHWKKERVVDLILFGIMHEIKKMQNLPIDTKPIDEAFGKHYPNIEEVIKSIG